MWVYDIVAIVVLWTRPGLSLRALRLIEVVLIGLPFLHQCQSEYFSLFVRHDLAHYVQLGLKGNLTGRAQVLPWFTLIIGYAVITPNTWRRCMAVVAVFVVTALGMNVAALTVDGLLAYPAGVSYLIELSVWLAFAVLFAVYNAHRIDRLRASAAQARKLGQYRLVRSLGAGGMGEVFLAEHALLRRPCAIKLIRSERAVDPAALARFEREVQATATLTHPNTIHIYDYGRADDGTFYCVMEYLPGLTLEELVKRHGPLPPARAVFLARQVCSALHEAHAIGLIHRDIKPGNVIVCARGGLPDTAKLLDFGLVLEQAVDSDDKVTREGFILGTPAYMSPEQADATCAVDARSDIYSFGAMLYFLLTGQPPFPRPSAIKAIAAHLSEPVPPPGEVRPEVPGDVQTVVLRCLAKTPAARFQTADELDAALAGCGCSGGWAAATAAEWWRDHTE